ncbi:MAG: DUF4382 domain-containing protein, partial [Deltaproteobacteria bacterium]
MSTRWNPVSSDPCFPHSENKANPSLLPLHRSMKRMKSRRQRLWQTGGLAALGLLLAACSGGGSGGSAGTSTLTVSLMDTPLAAVDNVTEVNVEIAAIWLKPAGSDAMQLPLTQTPMKVNLLALTDEHPALLIDGATVPAGDYEW